MSAAVNDRGDGARRCRGARTAGDDRPAGAAVASSCVKGGWGVQGDSDGQGGTGRNTDPYEKAWRRVLPTLGIAGVIGIVIYAAQFGRREFTLVIGSGLLVAGAAALAGGVIGFLFGIPRTVPGASAPGATGTQYQGNTNLEQISDWLTKILVGIGLVQIGHAPAALGRLAAQLKGGFGGTGTSAGFGLTVLQVLSSTRLMSSGQ
jgi:hypothetical protein